VRRMSVREEEEEKMRLREEDEEGKKERVCVVYWYPIQ